MEPAEVEDLKIYKRIEEGEEYVTKCPLTEAQMAYLQSVMAEAIPQYIRNCARNPRPSQTILMEMMGGPSDNALGSAVGLAFERACEYESNCMRKRKWFETEVKIKDWPADGEIQAAIESMPEGWEKDGLKRKFGDGEPKDKTCPFDELLTLLYKTKVFQIDGDDQQLIVKARFGTCKEAQEIVYHNNGGGLICDNKLRCPLYWAALKTELAASLANEAAQNMADAEGNEKETVEVRLPTEATEEERQKREKERQKWQEENK